MGFKIFISWSGQKSERVAHRLAEWLPSIVPNVDPLLSSNIPAGAMWLRDIADYLASAEMGLICVAKDNINSQWLNFEAGALWNHFAASIPICPVLIDLASSELTGPLSLFQAKPFDEQGMKTICRLLAEKTALSRERVDISFKAVWPRLKDDVTNDLNSFTTPAPKAKSTPSKDQNENDLKGAAIQIMSYLNHNDFDMVSFERIRERIDDSYSDEFLLSLIKKFPKKFRRATPKGAKPGT
ncbi:MAG: TIR domain-containing protein, partial [Dehalococcoidales bacterium]|nr:TIR domain-containing protein [Dehalococcoidales bacterium]